MLNKYLRNAGFAAALVGVSLLTLSCGQSKSGGGGSAVPTDNTQSGDPEAGLEEKKQAVTASMNELINSVTDPAIKAELEVGLQLIQQMKQGDAVEVLGKIYKTTSTSLDEVKAISNVSKLFLLPTDANAPAINFDPSVLSLGVKAEFSLQDSLLMNEDDVVRFSKKLIEILRTMTSDDAHSSVMLPGLGRFLFHIGPVVAGACFLNGILSCSDQKSNLLAANMLIFNYRNEIYDHFVADEVGKHWVERGIKLINEDHGELLNLFSNKKTPVINLIERLKALRVKVREPRDVGGTVSLPSGEVVLQLNGKNDVTVAQSGAFKFPNQANSQSKLNVTVKTAPVGQTCVVANATGRVTDTVTNINVTCSLPARTVGGSISGLPASTSAVLQLNSANDFTVSANGTFTFPGALGFNTSYTVSVKTSPSSYACTVANGTGTVTADVSNVAVTCVATQRNIGGTVSGLGGGTVVLRLNGASDHSVAADGSFTFPNKATIGAGYIVTVQTNAVGKTCTVANGSGTVSVDVTNVAVTCVTSQMDIGGTVSGLGGGTVVLRQNGADDLSVSVDGNFTFPTKVNFGAGYAVTVLTHAAGRSCVVVSGSGNANANITNVAVTCRVPRTVGGTISGLTGSVAIRLISFGNTEGNLTLSNNNPWVFVPTRFDGETYDVRVVTQPSGQTCTATGDVGTVNGNVTGVVITCVTAWEVGGTVTGLGMGLMVTLQLNGANDLMIPSDDSFTFTPKLNHNAAYTVSVSSQPPGQTCTVTSGTGNVTANVTNVAVNCTGP